MRAALELAGALSNETPVKGTTMPVLEIGLEPNDRIVAEPDEFSWMSATVQMRTTAYTAGARGIWGTIGRAFSGGGLFMTEYSAPAGPGASPRYCTTCSAAIASQGSGGLA